MEQVRDWKREGLRQRFGWRYWAVVALGIPVGWVVGQLVGTYIL